MIVIHSDIKQTVKFKAPTKRRPLLDLKFGKMKNRLSALLSIMVGLLSITVEIFRSFHALAVYRRAIYSLDVT